MSWLFPFSFYSNVIKSGMNERTSLFVSDLHLIGLIIIPKWMRKKFNVFSTFVRRIIIHLAMHKQTLQTHTQTPSYATQGLRLLITTFCHCYTQSIVFYRFLPPQMIAIHNDNRNKIELLMHLFAQRENQHAENNSIVKSFSVTNTQEKHQQVFLHSIHS